MDTPDFLKVRKWYVLAAIVIFGVLTFTFSLASYLQPNVEEIVIEENILTVSTPYMKLSFDFDNGGHIFELRSNINGEYNSFIGNYDYGRNIITEEVRGGIVDGIRHDAAWNDDSAGIVSWEKYSDQRNYNYAKYCRTSPDAACLGSWHEVKNLQPTTLERFGILKVPDDENTSWTSYEIKENSDSKIIIHISSNNSVDIGKPIFNFDWNVTIPKNETYFQIKHKTIALEEFTTHWGGDPVFRIVPNISSNESAFVNEFPWADLSGINERGDGLGVVTNNYASIEYSIFPWSRSEEITIFGKHQRKFFETMRQNTVFEFTRPVPIPERTTYIFLHGDYGNDGDTSNDWKYTEEFFQNISGLIE